MEKEPVWMEEIRQQTSKSRFYCKDDKKLERLKKQYLKTLDTLNDTQKKAVTRYVEQLQACEFQHVCTAYHEGIGVEKARQKARVDRFYQFVMNLDVMDGAVLARLIDLRRKVPEFQKKYDEFIKIENEYCFLKNSLPEESRAILNAYHTANEKLHNLLYHFAAGFPKGFIMEKF